MPILHEYSDKEGSYVLTNIKGVVVTFQVTKVGQDRLLENRVQYGKPFHRSLLLDLCRNGDAFTGGSGVTPAKPSLATGQLMLDFPDDPEPESLFPVCGECQSLDDLNLVEMLSGSHSAMLLCGSCRKKELSGIDTSIPLRVMTLALLRRVLEVKGFTQLHSSVASYLKLLEAEFSNYWEERTKSKSVRQEPLFESAQQDPLFRSTDRPENK